MKNRGKHRKTGEFRRKKGKKEILKSILYSGTYYRFLHDILTLGGPKSTAQRLTGTGCAALNTWRNECHQVNSKRPNHHIKLLNEMHTITKGNLAGISFSVFLNTSIGCCEFRLCFDVPRQIGFLKNNNSQAIRSVSIVRFLVSVLSLQSLVNPEATKYFPSQIMLSEPRRCAFKSAYGSLDFLILTAQLSSVSWRMETKLQ